MLLFQLSIFTANNIVIILSFQVTNVVVATSEVGVGIIHRTYAVVVCALIIIIIIIHTIIDHTFTIIIIYPTTTNDISMSIIIVAIFSDIIVFRVSIVVIVIHVVAASVDISNRCFPVVVFTEQIAGKDCVLVAWQQRPATRDASEARHVVHASL